MAVNLCHTSYEESASKCGAWEYRDGSLHCDGMSMEDLQHRLHLEFKHQATPAYIYSYLALKENVANYKEALKHLGDYGILSYSLKANSNPHIITTLRNAGVSMATTVSGNEILMAIKCGFPPERIILNGNGKQQWEIELAVSRGVLLNIDSVFDALQLVNVCKTLGMNARALLRLNPAIDAQTHPYLATALADSKFGVEMGQVDEVLRVVSAQEEGVGAEGNSQRDRLIDLQGVHIHIGSAISKVQVYSEMMKSAVQTLMHIRISGWPEASIINLGGGLGIDQTNPPYKHQSSSAADSLFITPPSQTPLSAESTSISLRSSQTEGNILDHHGNVTDINSGKGTDMDLQQKEFPVPKQLVEEVLPHLPRDTYLILEPGRSLVGTAGIVVTSILGVKSNAGKEFLVVDAAMTEVIRPSLYGAVHPISYITPPQHNEAAVFDVVGPVCESGDFLSRQCPLQSPISGEEANNSVYNRPVSNIQRVPYKSIPGTSLAIWNCGAYCSSMSSNYNLRPHAMEVLVTSPTKYKIIRKPQQFADLVSNF
ncbi:hypothetical protein SK128_005394 [Halocaridina rubra]|uniref:Orn/DAP/Arg decarboxylase 2 N-terminal domain-containing protein n=1 Tax=Halocaridina rubra TaxID=373956 RepID=A0AAN8X2A3_HALRR